MRWAGPVHYSLRVRFDYLVQWEHRGLRRDEDFYGSNIFTMQLPKPGHFNSADLNWDNEQADIPIHRLDDFIKGVGELPDCPCSYTKRRSAETCGTRGVGFKHTTDRYWCNYGPKDFRAEATSEIPARTKGMTGKNSRPRAQKRKMGTSMNRGCRSHFSVRFYAAFPDSCRIEWFHRQHTDKAGNVCHGKHDSSAVGANDAPIGQYLSRDVQEFIKRMVRTGVDISVILKEIHKQSRKRKRVEGMVAADWDRAKLVKLKDVSNIKMALKDEASKYSSHEGTSGILYWMKRNQDKLIFYQENEAEQNMSFAMAWATDWMLSQLATRGHGSGVAMELTMELAADSAFPRSEHVLYTLLCFDSFSNAIPGCWFILRRHREEDVEIVLHHIRMKVKEKRAAMGFPREWMPSCFIIEDASEECKAIRQIFPDLPMVLCLCRVRRAVLKNIDETVGCHLWKASISRKLGKLMYCTGDPVQVSDQIQEKWCSERPEFLAYYKKHWHARLERWVTQFGSYMHSNQNTNESIERWHLIMKVYLSADKKRNSCQSLSWLLHSLTNSFESFFWCMMNMKHQGRVQNSVVESFARKAIHRAMNIDDKDVLFALENGAKVATVISGRRRRVSHNIKNWERDEVSCTCGQLTQGSFCKHVIKCLLMGGHTEMNLLTMISTKLVTASGAWRGLFSELPDESASDSQEFQGTDGCDDETAPEHYRSRREHAPDHDLMCRESTREYDITSRESPSKPGNYFKDTSSYGCATGEFAPNRGSGSTDSAPENSSIPSVPADGLQVFSRVSTFDYENVSRDWFVQIVDDVWANVHSNRALRAYAGMKFIDLGKQLQDLASRHETLAREIVPSDDMRNRPQ